MEINAHSLVLLYRILRDKKWLKLFECLDCCSSQPCERHFRLLRSFCTVFVTCINMSVYEACQKQKRVNVLSKTLHELAKHCKFYAKNHTQ